MPTTAQGTIEYDASAALAMGQQAQRRLAASEVLIDSDTLLELAAADLQAIKTLQHEVEQQRTAITGPLNRALRAINDLFRAPTECLQHAERNLKGAILRYTNQREAEANQARAEAEQANECERERLLAEQLDWLAQAEEAETQARAAQAAGDPFAAQDAGSASQRHQAAAERARARAAALAQVAAVTTFASSAPAAPRPSGIQSRRTYIAVVTDLPALVQAVAQGQAPSACIQADERVLAAHARAAKRTGPLYPGVEVQARHALAAAPSAPARSVLEP